MSKSSSPKKNSITSSDEYDQLSDLYREAYDRPFPAIQKKHHELMLIKAREPKIRSANDFIEDKGLE